MTGKERIFLTLQGLQADKTPWVPFAGVHAGKLMGFTAKEVSRDLEKLVASQLEVNRMYQPDGQPVMFDLQIEAEVLGCDIVWSENSPPTVSSHPLAEVQAIPCQMPLPSQGRLPLELEATRRLKKEIGDTTALYGIICGPFTLASHLRGTNIFMDMILDPGYVHSLLAYTLEVAKKMAAYFIEAGIDVVAVVDPLVSQISPDHFEEFMQGPFSELFSFIREQKVFSSFFVCGNATKNIEPMCKTKPDSISVDENVNLAVAKEITDRYHLVMEGNIPLTSVMLYGNQQDNMKTVVELMDSVSKEHLIISPGCDMPYDIPIENTVAIAQSVHETDIVRKMVENYQSTEIAFEGTLPDYENLARPLVEVFTLDSTTCAACTYMLASAKDAEKYTGFEIDLVEYKYTIPQNIARCRVMGVKQLPSIYINGKLAFSSIIPGRDELIARIKEARDGN
jgi:uroporphyrinogen decarboxylase